MKSGTSAGSWHDDRGRLGAAPWGAGQVGVVGEQPLVAHPGTRLDAELVDEDGAQASEGPQRLGLPAAAVEREHEPVPGLLTQRVLVDQVRQLADELGVPAAVEVGVDPGVERGEALLVEPPGLGGDRGGGGHVGDRRAAPQRERLPEQLGGLVGALGAVALVRFGAEQGHIGVLGLQAIPGGDGGEHPAVGVADERAQPQDVSVHLGGGGLGRRLAPQLVHDPVDGDHLVRPDQQGGQQQPDLRRPDAHPAVAVEHLHRPEQPELHRVETSPDRGPSCLPPYYRRCCD
nr:hypothetical protein [Actinophytocola sp.]